MAYFDKYGVEFTDNRKTVVYCPRDFLGKYTIPNEVTCIGVKAFAGCTRLTSINIPNSVIDIKSAAFCGCSELKELTIPEGVIQIGDYAFADCIELISITLSKTIHLLGEGVFDSCSKLPSIFIPSGVKRIRHGVFNSCTQLASVIVDGDNEVFDSRDNCNAIIYTSSNTLIAGCKTTVIPNSVNSIECYAFDGCVTLSSIVIPQSVKNIEMFAFEGCINLTSITIHSDNITIEEGVFDDCINLKRIFVPKGSKNYFKQIGALRNDADNIVEIGEKTSKETCEIEFSRDLKLLVKYRADLLGRYVIPETVVKIGDEAFLNCKGLTSVLIPNSVTEIGDRSFAECSNLVEVSIAQSVKNIGYCAFMWCNSLQTISIPIGVRHIGAYAFSGCQNLTSVSLPSTIISIDEQAFSGCVKLERIIIPEGMCSYFEGLSALEEYIDIIEDSGEDELVDLFNKAHALEYGINVRQNSRKAFEIYKLAASKGNFEAEYHLGEWYVKGEHIPQDLVMALECFERLAEYEYMDSNERVRDVYKLIDEKNKIEEQKRLNEQKRKNARSKEEEAIIKILEENKIGAFYHFTSIRNLESIKEQGGLYSWYYLKKNGMDIPFTGGNELSHSLDTSKKIADYVHLSFCKDHPMTYRLYGEGEDVAVLTISPEVALLKDTLFSNMNAIDANAIVKGGANGLNCVNFEATKEKYVSRDDPMFKYHQAEVLVKTHIPLKYILDLDDYID